MQQLILRKLMAGGIVLLVIAAAAYISYDMRVTCELTHVPLKKIVSVDDFRTLMHVFIFGMVAFLVGPWGKEGQRGSIWLAWIYVIIGGIGIEFVQTVLGCGRSFTAWVDMFVDLGMDFLGGGIGIWLAARLDRKLSGGFYSDHR